MQARTKTGRAQSAKKVVRQEGEGTDHARDIWWHLAAQLRFPESAPGSWGLTIRPEFQLTKDGREPLPSPGGSPQGNQPQVTHL